MDRKGAGLLPGTSYLLLVIGVLHVVVGPVGVVVVSGGINWLLDSVIWSQQLGRGEKGGQSNREYSSEVLARLTSDLY
jgi:hypothetical protein